MTEAKKMVFAHPNNGKQIFNSPAATADPSYNFVEQDTFVELLAARLRMLSDENRINAMLEILAMLNQATRLEETQ